MTNAAYVHVTLRSPRASDADWIGESLKEKDIAESIPGLGSAGISSANQILNHALLLSAELKEHHFVIEADGTAVGMCVLYNIYNDGAEIGYWVCSAYRRKGYATAAIRILAGKAYLIGVRRIRAIVMRSNSASIALLNLMGFKASGNVGDQVEYSADTASIKA